MGAVLLDPKVEMAKWLSQAQPQVHEKFMMKPGFEVTVSNENVTSITRSSIVDRTMLDSAPATGRPWEPAEHGPMDGPAVSEKDSGLSEVMDGDNGVNEYPVASLVSISGAIPLGALLIKMHGATIAQALMNFWEMSPETSRKIEGWFRRLVPGLSVRFRTGSMATISHTMGFQSANLVMIRGRDGRPMTARMYEGYKKARL